MSDNELNSPGYEIPDEMKDVVAVTTLDNKFCDGRRHHRSVRYDVIPDERTGKNTEYNACNCYGSKFHSGSGFR